VTHVVVAGGGITGLVAAREAVRAGATVTVVEPGPLGGKVRASAFAGALLDEAADNFLARVPEGIDLCRELGLEGDLIAPAVRRARVWSRGALRLLPEGQLLGVPTDLDELAASEILSPDGVRRVADDLSAPRTALDGDVAIGAMVRGRLGDEALERLVDPLVGGINAGDTDELSLAATVPQLDAAARSDEASLIRACQSQRAQVTDARAPVFFAPRAGMRALVDALVADLEARGVAFVPSTVVGLDAVGARWRVDVDPGPSLEADGVVVTVPAAAAAELVRPHAGRAATLLASIPYASVAMLSLAVPRDAVDRELDASGFLVPRVEGRTVTACTWTSAKWPHLAGADAVWLRASVGRAGDDAALSHPDDALVAAVLRDLADLMGLRGRPTEARLTRWPRSLPQYRPGHLDRIQAVDDELASVTPALVVAGAALRGLGIPACIRQGAGATDRVLAALDARP
jgi:oxygen-dependent protoporphyrinogen oxidase